MDEIITKKHELLYNFAAGKIGVEKAFILWEKILKTAWRAGLICSTERDDLDNQFTYELCKLC